jgi:hypothetical protein
MRLSEWRKKAPTEEAMNEQVVKVLRPVLRDLGAEDDAECWVAWGEDPEFRYSILAPTIAGLISAAVRISGSEEGPRVTAKLIRWSKLSVSELSVEASGGHRIVAVQVEGTILKGVDEEADLIAGFTRGLIAEIDGRKPPAVPIAIVQGVVPAGMAAVPEGRAGAPVGVATPAAGVPAPEKPAGDEPGQAGRKKPDRGRGSDSKARASAGSTEKGLVPVAAAPTPGAADTPATVAAAPTPGAADKPVRAAARKPSAGGTAGRAARPATRSGARPRPVPISEPGAAPVPEPGPTPAPEPSAGTPPARKPDRPEPELPAWVAPHPIEERRPDKPRPRPWQP